MTENFSQLNALVLITEPPYVDYERVGGFMFQQREAPIV